ncbi:MAG: glycosyltransferase, partial [Rhodospirillales bacterium]
SELENLVLTSLMVRLNCDTAWEKLLIPAFVFFFQKLYPFPRVNDPDQKLAAAAGGCMLVRKSALDAVGGVTRIQDAVIDDCALARLLKREGPVWLGLAGKTRSLRRYSRLGEIWDMVARTAYTQLRHSPALLIGSVAGMMLLYLMPVASLVTGLLTGDVAVALGSAVTLSLMTVCFLPTIQLYRLPLVWALTLPVAGLLYGLMTWSSGYRHWRGRGGGWKGRTYSRAGETGQQAHD